MIRTLNVPLKNAKGKAVGHEVEIPNDRALHTPKSIRAHWGSADLSYEKLEALRGWHCAKVGKHIWRMHLHRRAGRFDCADRIRRRLSMSGIKIEVEKNAIWFSMPWGPPWHGFQNLDEPNLY